jgi:four helix bundle protein
LTFPKIEQFALADQIRRAAMSIPMNFAEGYGKRRSEAEFKRYLMMAVGSCDEVRVQVDFSKDLGYISESDHSKFSQEYDEIGKMLNSLWQNWRTLNA